MTYPNGQNSMYIIRQREKSLTVGLKRRLVNLNFVSFYVSFCLNFQKEKLNTFPEFFCWKNSPPYCTCRLMAFLPVSLYFHFIAGYTWTFMGKNSLFISFIYLDVLLLYLLLYFFEFPCFLSNIYLKSTTAFFVTVLIYHDLLPLSIYLFLSKFIFCFSLSLLFMLIISCFLFYLYWLILLSLFLFL